MSQYVVPNVEAVKAMLELLFGEGLKVTPNDSEIAADSHLATFLSDDDKVVALCSCDDHFVAFAGAALTMVPGNVAAEMVAEKNFSETVLANFHEVMNICSRLLMSERSPHLRLGQTVPPDQTASFTAALENNAAAVGFDVDIPRYGRGNVVFRIC